jgi:hypothetical protein
MDNTENNSPINTKHGIDISTVDITMWHDLQCIIPVKALIKNLNAIIKGLGYGV